MTLDSWAGNENVNFDRSMNRKLTRCIAVILMLIFTSAFSMQSLAMLTRNFTIELYALLYGKYIKTVDDSNSGNESEEASPCVEETEDESEMQFDPIALIAAIYYKIFALQTQRTQFIESADPAHNIGASKPLYLTTHTFRI